MIDITGKAGCLWPGQWSPLSRNGLSSVLSGRHILQAAWNRTGSAAVMSDSKGNILLVDARANRWQWICQISPTPCGLLFGLTRENEFLVSLPDTQVKCYDLTGQLISIMGGHHKTVQQMVINSSGTEAITVSQDLAQVWSMTTFERLRQLSVSEKSQLHSVHYIDDEHLVTCFRDNSLFVWQSEKCLGQLWGPEGVQVTAVYVDRAKRQVIMGGRSDKFYFYALNEMKLVSILEVKNMSKLKSLGTALGLPEHVIYLADGQIRLLNTTDAKIDLSLNGPSDPVRAMACSNEWVLMINDSGIVQLFNLPTIKSTVAPLESNQTIPEVTSASPERKSTRESLKTNHSTGRLNTRPLSTQDKLNRHELRQVLNGFGEFPARYRLLIWRHLLKVPENESSFAALVERGRHPSCDDLAERYPLKSSRLYRALERTLSCVAQWNSLFGELDYIALMLFPFVKVFQHSPIHCFEVCSSVLFNWSRDWFTFYPNPPIPILAQIENVINHHDARLIRHLTSCEITSQDYAWPLMQTMFSEVFPKDDWLVLFDHVFFNHPSFLLYCVAAYVVIARGPLLSLSAKSDFHFFFHHRNPIQARQVVAEARRLQRNTPRELDLKRLVKKYEPLTEGHYPILNKYPQFVVDYRRRETDKVRKREIDFIKEKHDEQLPVKIAETTNAEFTRSTFHLGTDFKRGIVDAQRARKMLLASFSS